MDKVHHRKQIKKIRKKRFRWLQFEEDFDITVELKGLVA
jgi:hypothetical protein